ncbi:MAG: 5'/3'-nucleotidase SurE [Peptococcia bacterium]
MQILITNDDGIMAPGIQELARKMSQVGEVIVSAPMEEQSAIGHGITIRDPIRIRSMNFPNITKAWAVGGTPADCVKLAVQEFIDEKCSLVLSGINNGPNLGTDVLYSGTVSAAIEGAIQGMTSMAISLASFGAEDYSTAAEITCFLAQKVYEHRHLIPPDTLLNVNIPAVPREKLKGFRITKLGQREYANVFDRRIDPRGNTYFWLGGEVVPHKDEDPDVDSVAVANNYVSITPIHFDLTNYRIMNRIKDMELENLEIPPAE